MSIMNNNQGYPVQGAGCRVLESVDSTNAYLKEWLTKEDLEENTVVVAHHQTAGRGQTGASWESEPGKNLTFSLLLYPSFLPFNQHFLILQAVSLGIKDVLAHYVHDISIKWPNDLYWENKKMGGILIENAIEGSIFQSSVIGVGLNVNQDVFYSDAPNPVSLKQITGQEIILEELLNQLWDNILLYYNQIREEIQRPVIAQAYKQSLYRKEGYYPYNDAAGDFLARIADVEENGQLVLEDIHQQIRRYSFKEVRITS